MTTALKERKEDVVLTYLSKTNNDAQGAYNEYIKDCLMSGKELIVGMKDFLPSKPKTKRKVYKTKKKISPKDYELKTAEEIVSHITFLHKCSVETFELRKVKPTRHDQRELLYAWHDVQSYKALICSITGEEYVYEQMPTTL